MKSLGQDVSQCSQANDEFNLNGCCPSASAADGCDQGGWPQFDKHNIKFSQTTNQAIPFAELTKQIGCRKQPVAFSWKWLGGGGGHMMVAIGYAVRDGTDWVEVNDPWQPNVGRHSFITYEEYVAAVNNHDHWNDFFNFNP
jgi:hypothetical protein